jgi:starch-binding outer membrane protein, SusD/RagB family
MKKLLIVTAMALLYISCNDDILDIAPTDLISETIVWEDENLTKAYHNALYNGILHGFNIHMQSKATDEAYNSIGGILGLFPEVP